MKFKYFICIIFCFCASLFTGSYLFGNVLAVRSFADGNLPEKLYLHIDRTYFMAGETLWFKGYLVNADAQDNTPESNFIYVELLRDTIIKRVKIKRDYYGFSGHISIPASLPSGNYVLRAYTRWQMNWPTESMFHERIKISATGKQSAESRIYGAIGLQEGSNNVKDNLLQNRQPVNCSVIFDKESYGKRDRIAAQISLTNEKGEPLEGDFSISVVRGAFKAHQQQMNMHTYMSTWSSFAMNQGNVSAYSRIMLPREYTQSITGGIYNKRPKKILQHNVNFISLAGEYASSATLQTGDQITLDNLDFPDSTKFSAIFKPVGGDKFRWEKDTFAVWNKEQMKHLFDDEHNMAGGGTGAVGIQNRKIQQQLARKQMVQDVFLQNEIKTDTLKALTVSAYRESGFVKVESASISPLGQQVFERRSVKSRNEMEKYDAMPLIDYIIYRCNFGIRGTTYAGEPLIVSRVQGTLGGGARPHVYINGFEDRDNTLGRLYVRDAETVVILKGIEGALYNTINGVILVELRNAHNLKYTHGYNRNSVSIVPLGYQRPGYFATPVYNTALKRGSSIPDRRNTIYWNPSLYISPDGKNFITFYASDDISVPYFIRIEGMTSGGQPFSWEGEVEVDF